MWACGNAIDEQLWPFTRPAQARSRHEVAERLRFGTGSGVENHGQKDLVESVGE